LNACICASFFMSSTEAPSCFPFLVVLLHHSLTIGSLPLMTGLGCQMSLLIMLAAVQNDFLHLKAQSQMHDRWSHFRHDPSSVPPPGAPCSSRRLPKERGGWLLCALFSLLSSLFSSSAAAAAAPSFPNRPLDPPLPDLCRWRLRLLLAA